MKRYFVLIISFFLIASAFAKETHKTNKSKQSKNAAKKHKHHKKHYVPKNKNYYQGLATYYADKFVGCRTASGKRFSQEEFMAATPKFPFGTYLKVTNQDTSDYVYVSNSDRMRNIVIDLSKRAFQEISDHKTGHINVVLEPATKEEYDQFIVSYQIEHANDAPDPDCSYFDESGNLKLDKDASGVVSDKQNASEVE